MSKLQEYSSCQWTTIPGMDKCEIQNLKTLCYITSSILKVVYLFMGCIK